MTGAAWDAIVLAGGRSRRFGGDKLTARIDGAPLVAHAISAVDSARTIVVVGPDGLPLPEDERVRVVRDDPGFGGPVAGLVAGLPFTSAPVVVVIAGDTYGAADDIAALIAGLAAADQVDVAYGVDALGHAQPLLAAWRSEALASRLTAVGSGQGVPARRLLDGVEALTMTVTARDIDRPDDLAGLPTDEVREGS